MTGKLCLAQDPEADALLDAHPFALLMGMLLDQQVPIRWKNAATKEAACHSRGTHLDLL